MDLLTLEKKKAWVMCLSIDCPFGKAFDSCPVKEVRKLSGSDRINTTKGMAENQLDQIIAQHRVCLRQREDVFLD